MQEWTQTDGYRTKTIKLGNATIYVKRPILSKTEYRQREKAAQNALEAYGRTIK
jgi:hypothetical protein